MKKLITINKMQSIRDCCLGIEKRFKVSGKIVGKHVLRFGGRQKKEDVFRLGKHKVFVAFSHFGKNCYLYTFWNSNPVKSGLAADCRMIIPFSGVNLKYSSAFAIDHSGQELLVHRGVFFGGAAVARKKVFFEKFKGPTNMTNDGIMGENKVAIVADINRKDFIKSLARFLHQVKIITSEKPPKKASTRIRKENRELVKRAVLDLNKRIKNNKDVLVKNFESHQHHKVEEAYAILPFSFQNGTIILESELSKKYVIISVYPTAKKIGKKTCIKFKKELAKKLKDSELDLGKGIPKQVLHRVPIYTSESDKRRKIYFIYTADLTEAIIKVLKGQ